MITNDAIEEDQQRETNTGELQTSCQNQVAVPGNNNSVVKATSSSGSDDWSTSEDEDDGKQVAEIRSQAPTDNVQRIINTYSDCTNVTSNVQNTTIYKDGVTVNHNVYCCPASLDYVLKWRATSRTLVIFIVSLLGILLTVFLGLWLSNLDVPKHPNDIETETTSIISTTAEMPQSTTIVIPSSSTTTTEIIPSSSDSSNSNNTENPNPGWKIIERKDWRATPPIERPVKLEWFPPMYVIFSETETDMCTTTQKCKETVRNIQAANMKVGFNDIKYSFLIGGDGMIYEGQGWDVYTPLDGYDTDYFDDICIKVSFIGKYDVEKPTDVILQAAKTFLEFGSRNGTLVKSPRLKCHRQLSHTIKNPGDNLYKIIETWKGWDSRTIESFT